MKALISGMYQHSFFRFCVVGVTNTGIDFSVFFFLYSVCDWAILPANVTAFTCSLINSYVVNHLWTFTHAKQPPLSLRKFSFFTFVSLISVTLSTSFLLLGKVYLPVFILKCLTILFIPILNYFMYRFIVFKKEDPLTAT